MDVAALAIAHDLDLVLLFGSRATGRTHAGSDVDLAIRSSRGPLGAHDVLDLSAAFSALSPGTTTDLVDLRRADPLLLHKIFEQAKVLWEASPGLFSEARLYAFHRYEDYRPYLRLEHEAIRRVLFGDGR